MSASSTRVSTRTFLLIFSLALLVPTFSLIALALSYYAITERNRLETDALQTAREASGLVDSEIRNLVATLNGLATSSALSRNDLADFHEQATRLVRDRDENIVLRTISGNQLVNTQVPFGATLAQVAALPPDAVQAYNPEKPSVSNVYDNPISGEPRIAVAQKMTSAGPSDTVLAITVPTTRFLKAIQPVVTSGWLFGVADRTGKYITHSTRHAEVSGKPGFSSYLAGATAKEGVYYANNAAGVELLAGYHRSELTGWLTAANIPSDRLQASLRRSVAIAASAGLAMFFLTSLLAFLFSRRLSGSARGLAERAEALGQGRTLSPMTSGITEFAIVDRAMIHASQAVSERASLTHKLAETVQQKDVLLKEVNHRVKNSLQLVASLLNLQRNQIADQHTRQQFEEAARRINTVAQIHQRLYRDDRPDRVALHQFLGDLCDDLNNIFPEREIKIVCDASECFLSTDRVIPLALIINELIANSFKYSFPENTGGTIQVACRDAPGAVVVSISDDGAPLPPGFDPNAKSGLGMKIITALAKQLRAPLEIQNLEVGKIFTLRIPADDAFDGGAPRA